VSRSRREEFLSDEDLDLASLSEVELLAWWQLWLEAAQASNDLDEHDYSHGVFRHAPGAPAARPASAGGCG
jgi:hypothetical protein